MQHLPAKLLQGLRSDWPQHPDIIELTTNPLNAALLCILCDDYKGDLPNKKTQLYVEVVSCVLRIYETKQGFSRHSLDPITVYKEELMQFGHLALHCLHNGQSYFKEHESGSFVLTKFGFLSIQTDDS